MRLVGTGAGSATYDKTYLKLKDIHGLPPTAYWEATDGDETGTGYNPALAAFPVVIMEPLLPKFGPMSGEEVGLTLFSAMREGAKERYEEIVGGVGIGAKTDIPLYFAILNDTTISESFNNDYGESAFESTIQGLIPRGKLAEIARIAGGGESLTTGVENVAERLDKITRTLLKPATKIGGYAEALLDRFTPGAAGSKILAGSMVDFPMIWQGTSYTASYSFTVREALSVGVPVIVSDLEAQSSAVIDNHNGLHFRNRDVKDLSEKMALLASQHELSAKLSENAKNTPIKSINEQTNTLEELYEKIIR